MLHFFNRYFIFENVRGLCFFNIWLVNKIIESLFHYKFSSMQRMHLNGHKTQKGCINLIVQKIRINKNKISRLVLQGRPFLGPALPLAPQLQHLLLQLQHLLLQLQLPLGGALGGKYIHTNFILIFLKIQRQRIRAPTFI